MNILVIQNFGGLGGGSRSGLDVAKMLKSLGNKVSMIIDSPADDITKMVEDSGISLVVDHPPLIIYCFHSASGLAIKSPLRYYANKKYENLWMDFFQKNIYDLVILNSSVLCPLAKILKGLGIKNITFVRETFRKNFFLNRQQRSMIACSDAAVYLTEYDKTMWNMHCKEYVIPDAVDPDFFENFEEEKSDNVNFLYLGGLNFYKGALDLLKAVKEVCNSHVDEAFSLTILGDTYDEYISFSMLRKIIHYKHVKYREKSLALIREINQIRPNTVSLIGLTQNVSEYYARCSAVVFPVKRVHQPRPAYEAGNYGKMIIVPDYSNFRDNVHERWNGMYYQKNNITSLRDCLLEVIGNAELVENCGKNNHIFVKDYHSFSVVEASLFKVINEVMTSKS